MRVFQHTAARRRLACFAKESECSYPGFNTQPPEGGWKFRNLLNALSIGFNTQPPEGGWDFTPLVWRQVVCFNTQPPEGGWEEIR